MSLTSRISWSVEAQQSGYEVDHLGFVGRILEGRSLPLEPTVRVAAGPVFFGSAMTSALLSLAATSPVDGCTQVGLDGGANPLGLALDSDLLTASFSGSSRDEFLKKEQRNQQVSRVVWEMLSPFRVRAVELEGVFLEVRDPTTAGNFEKRIPRASTHPHTFSAAPLGQGDEMTVYFVDRC